MANNSPVFWSVAQLGAPNIEFSLHTMAWSVKSFSGTRFAGPSKRGENISVPFRNGALYTPKMRGAKSFTMSMWVLPHHPDGGKDPSMTYEQRSHANYLAIMDAVDVDGLFLLKKRWWENGAVQVAVAQAEFIQASSADSDDKLGFNLSIDVSLADPYFYGAVSASRALGSPYPVLGNVKTSHVYLTLTGGSAPIRVTFPDGNWVQYIGSFAGGPVTLNLDSCSATQGANYVDGLIQRNPAFSEWPMLRPTGAGVVTVAVSGGGTGSYTYQPAYR